MVLLDRVAAALHMTDDHAMVTIAALRCAFEINGKQLKFNETAKIVLEAVKHADSDDPDVRYAVEWLKQRESLKSAR